MHFNVVDLTGQRFGRLIVISQSSNVGRRVAWMCQCECGKSCVVIAMLLRAGGTRSCGCLRMEVSRKRMTVHGYARRGMTIPEHKVWTGMLKRCNDTTSDKYVHYGGRGITVCERWKYFPNFLEDMGPRPSKRHSIDRIDNNGNYEPSNCRWATQPEQMQNTRVTRKFTINGKTQSISAWSKECGVNDSTIHARLKRGLSIQQALELAD